MFPLWFTFLGGSFVFLDMGASNLFIVFPLFFWVLYFLFDCLGFNSIPNRTKRVYKNHLHTPKRLKEFISCTCLQFPIWPPFVKTSGTPVDKMNQLVKTIDIIHCTCLQLPTSPPQRGPTPQY